MFNNSSHGVYGIFMRLMSPEKNIFRQLARRKSSVLHWRRFESPGWRELPFHHHKTIHEDLSWIGDTGIPRMMATTFETSNSTNGFLGFQAKSMVDVTTVARLSLPVLLRYKVQQYLQETYLFLPMTRRKRILPSRLNSQLVSTILQHQGLLVQGWHFFGGYTVYVGISLW